MSHPRSTAWAWSAPSSATALSSRSVLPAIDDVFVVTTFGEPRAPCRAAAPATHRPRGRAPASLAVPSTARSVRAGQVGDRRPAVAGVALSSPCAISNASRKAARVAFTPTAGTDRLLIASRENGSALDRQRGSRLAEIIEPSSAASSPRRRMKLFDAASTVTCTLDDEVRRHRFDLPTPRCGATRR